jgi:hypothetical protein
MAKNFLSKSDYIAYLSCPEEFWLSKYQPELFDPMPADRLFSIKQGNQVDAFAQKLFKEKRFLHQFKLGQRVPEFQKRVEVTIEQTASADNEGQQPDNPKQQVGYLAIADVAIWDDEAKVYDLFEVKASKEVKEEYIHDLAFQKMVFERAGWRVRKTYLVHISPTYVFDGDLDAYSFFRVPNIADRVAKIMDFTRRSASEALAFINNPTEPSGYFKLCENKLDCVYLKKNFSDLPPYSVFDIARLGSKKLEELLARQIIDITEVPKTFELSPKQRQQVEVAQSGEIIINQKEIRHYTEGWSAPYYFLDYETINLVFPRYAGYTPYQQMAFQYSLHTVDTEGLMTHSEFLIQDKNQTPLDLLAQLQKDIPHDGGTVFVWSASFEKTRNKEMAVLYPVFKDFLLGLNDRIFDLEIPFKTQAYQHPAFKGKSSIKKVLPVLVPELSYKNLAIQHGGMAFTEWYRMMFEEKDETIQAQIGRDLLAYCALDTLAMVKIWAILKAI